jgi:hypothetical protein
MRILLPTTEASCAPMDHAAVAAAAHVQNNPTFACGPLYDIFTTTDPYSHLA